MKLNMKKIISGLLSGCFITGAMLGDVSMVLGSQATAPIKITVGKGSGYDYNSIQEAVDSIKNIPTEKNQATINVSEGIYEESVNIDLPYVKLINNNEKADVIITYDKATGHEDSTKNFGTQKTATVTIGENAIGFSAENIIFQNSYNLGENEREQSQAVALVSLADKVSFDKCKFVGRQDTLYLKGASQGQKTSEVNSARVYLKDCYVEGTVDFIFGDATAYFDNCTLNMAYYKNGGHYTAANTTLYNIGYVFNNCKLTVDKQYTEADSQLIDLGRPWQSDSNYPYYGAQVVYLNCTMPEIYNQKGFTVWDNGTQTNKIRFMEYGTKDSKGKAIDLSCRADFVRVLTEDQARVYSAYNVLKGEDGWNPATAERDNKKQAMDITLRECNIDIPNGDSSQLAVNILPADTIDKTLVYRSENESIVTVDSNGKLTAKKEGSTKVYVSTENGFEVYANVNVTPARTPVPEISTISIGYKDTMYPEQTLTANYSYVLSSDNAIDKAVIRWYAVKDNKEILLKEGVGKEYTAYTLTTADIGYNIKIGVFPATDTTYGIKGKEMTAVTKTAVSEPEKSIVPALYLRDSFNNGTGDWIIKGDNEQPWNVEDNEGNVSLTPNTESGLVSKLEYNKKTKNSWGDTTIESKFRFNPEGTGLTADDYFDIYTSYNGKEKSYYKLRFVRGGNTKSLIAQLYKKSADGSEELLASDNTSLKNKVNQNSGYENPYFYVKEIMENGKITITLTLENADTPAMRLTAIDESPIDGGTVAFEAQGKNSIWQLHYVSVQETPRRDENNITRIYLAGDSTVKYYGDDNTIGGWGEYLQYYFNDNVDIHNMAEGGRSTRSYINQGRLDEITDEIRQGDYLFIQFGHNDERTDDPARVEHSVVLGEADENGVYPTIPAIKQPTPQRIIDFYKDTDYPYGKEFYPYESGTFKWYLSQYVKAARDKGAKPVLITPVCRVFFDSDGKIVPHHGDDNGYVKAVLQVAEEMDCEYVDMFEITKNLYESYGVMVTQSLQNVKEDGSMDLTHYNKFGANIVTSKLIAALDEQGLPVAKETRASNKSVSKTDDMREASLYVVGDGYSAKAVDNDDYLVEYDGWGNYLSKYLSDKITVKNLAVDGASAKSYIDESNYKTLMDTVNEGDYVMINFGKTDGSKANTDDVLNKYSDPATGKEVKGSFKYYMYEYYIKPLKEKKAVPIIITPSASRSYDINGNVNDTVGLYDDALKELVVEEQLYFVDLTALSAELYTNMGQEGGKVLNAINSKGMDNNHYSKFGADTVAKHILSSMKFSSATLKNYIDDSKLTAITPISKADFTVALMRVMEEDRDINNNNFMDIVKGKYYEKAIANAKELGIAIGDNKGNFYPESALTKEEMDKMLRKALSYKGINPEVLSDVYAIDGDNISYEIGLWAIARMYEAINC